MREPNAKNNDAASAVFQKPKWVGWVIKFSFIGLFLLVLIVSAAFLLFQTGPVRSYLKNFLVSQIENHLNAKIVVGNIKGSFISNVTLEDVKVSDSTDTLLSLERVSAEYTLPLLIKNMVFLNSITIDGLHVNLRQNADGVWNVMDLVKPGEPSPESDATKAFDFKVAIKNLLIKNSRVTIQDNPANQAEKRQLDIIRCDLDVSVGQQIAVHITESQFSVSRPAFNNVAITGRAVFDPATSFLKINPLNVRSGTSDLALSGLFSFNEKSTYDIKLDCKPLSLEELGKGFSLSLGLTENLIGSVSIKGDNDQLTCHTAIDYQDAQLSANGDIDLAALPNLNMHLAGALRNFNPERMPFESLKPYAGNLNTDFKASFSASETLAAGKGAFSLQVLPSHITGTKVASGGLVLEFLNGDLFLKDTFLSSALGNMRAEGRVSKLADNKSRKKVDLAVFLQNIRLQQISQLQASGVSGTMNLDIKASAALPPDDSLSEGAFTVHATPHDSAITFSDKKIPTEALHAVHMDAAWKDQHVIITSSHLTTDFGNVNARGNFDIQNLTGTLTTDADLTNLRRLSEALFPFIPNLPQDLALSGSVKLNATADGSFNAPRLTYQLRGAGMGALDFFAKDLTVKGAWLGSLAQFNSEVSLSMTGFEGKGHRVNLVDATARVRNDGAAFTLDMVHDMGHHLNAEGTIDIPKAQPAKITISRLMLQPKGLGTIDTMQNRGPIRLDLHQGTVDVIACRLAADKATIDLSGRIATTGAQNLNLSVKSENLILSHLPFSASKEYFLDGLLNVDLLLAGTLSAPMVSGSISLSDGKANLLKRGLTYEQLEANILFQNDDIDIQKLLVRGDKEGFLQGTGRIGLKDGALSQFNITLIGENFLIPYQKSIYARVSPQLMLTGDGNAPMLKGQVHVHESRINLDRMAPETPPEIEIIEAPTGEATEQHIAEEAPPLEILKGLIAHVAVKAPGNIWLKGQDINAEVAGDMLLKKEAGKPFTLLGELHTLRGIYYFRGRQFKVEKGTVTFIGLEEPNPNIDIKAAAKIQKARIIILISGTARDLVLNLDSEPKMNPSDIISYLVFGKSTNGLKGGQAFNAEKAALGVSGGLLASELRSILGNVFFIDSFALDSGESGAGGSVAVGKYVRPNIFILYHRGFAEEKQNQIEISYEYNPNIRIETQIGDDKNNGVDLFWEFDF